MTLDRRIEREAREEIRKLSFRRQQIDKAIQALEQLESQQCAAPDMPLGGLRMIKLSTPGFGTRSRCVSHRHRAHR